MHFLNYTETFTLTLFPKTEHQLCRSATWSRTQTIIPVWQEFPAFYWLTTDLIREQNYTSERKQAENSKVRIPGMPVSGQM